MQTTIEMGPRAPGFRALDRSVSRIGLFWYAVTLCVLLLGARDALTAYPHSITLHSARGLAMLALMVLYSAWFWLVMAWRRGLRRAWPVGVWKAYLILGVGLGLSALLIQLSPAFGGLAYVVVGMSTMLPTRQGLVPLVAAIGFNPARMDSGQAWALFGLAMSIGISYSIAALVRQRYERERLIVELQEAQRQLRVSAAREVELAALRERNRLAREMHDSLGHALVLIAIKIEAAQRLHAVDPRQADAQWEETKALVRATMADLRTSLAGLRLPALDERPFDEALGELASDLTRRTGLDVSSHVDGAALLLDRAVQEALYRVAQEGLANVDKHARARHAWLTLHVRDGAAELEVRDDGIGLADAPRHDGHYGVIGMRERVASLGGVLTLGPRSDGGTVLRARVPLKETERERHSDPVVRGSDAAALRVAHHT